MNEITNGKNGAAIRVFIVGDKSLVRPSLSNEWMHQRYEWIFSKNSPPFDTSNLQTSHPDIILIALFGDESANEVSSILPDLLKLNLPVIFLSRELNAEWMLTLMKKDAFELVFAPFDASKLNESLQVALFRKQLAQKTEIVVQPPPAPFQSPSEIKSEKWREDLINDRLVYLEKLIRRSTNLITGKYQQAQQIINNALVAIISMDSQGCITAWNPQAERTFGWNCDEVIGAKLTEIILPPSKDAQDKTSPFTYDILNEQESIDHLMELQGVRSNKQVFPMELSFATISLVNAFQICIFIRDISNRKEAEKKLNLAQAHTRFLFDLSKKLAEADSSRSAGKAILQSINTILDWDSSWIDLYDQNTQTFENLIAFDTIENTHREVSIKPDLYRKPSKMVQGAIAKGPQIILRNTGTENIGAAGVFGSCNKSLSLLVVPIKLGEQILGIFSIQSYQSNAYVASDLNILNSVANQIAGALDRIRNASALADNEKQLTRVWETTVDGMALANAKGIIVQLNTAFAKIAAKPKSELLGKNLASIYHPSQQAAVSKNYINQFEKRELSGLLKQEIRLWNGIYRWIESSNSYVDNNTKGILQLIVLRDVTEQEKFNQARTHAQRLESLGTLAGGIAHDLNNALAPITMSIELIQRRYPESCNLLKTVESSANRAADMVRRLLTFSRGSNEKPTNLQSRQLVDEIEKLILRTFPKNIELEITHHAGDCPIYGDATQLHQLLLNLCINARDAMPKGGRISIDTDLTAKAPPHSHNQKLKPGPFVVWRVSDTGCGIPKEALHRIFDPYFTTKGPENGTGIGLSIVLGIARSHGGCVQATSSLNKGSCFNVYLPLRDQTTKTESEAPASNTFINGKGKTVLLIDDEPAVLELLRLLLEDMDFEVIDVNNGAEAQERICKKSEDICLIITDMHMPGMSGLQLSKNLRNLDIKIPIILSSGRVEPNIAKAFKEFGVHTIIHKPFNSLSLKKAIIQELTTDGCNC